MGFELIETIEVGAGGAASIEFTGIPTDGVDLVLTTSLRTDYLQPTGTVLLYLNSDTTNSNYIYNLVRATMFAGSGGGSVQALTNPYRPFWNMPGGESSSATFSSDRVVICNSNSTTNKIVSLESANENYNSGNGLAEANMYFEAGSYTTSSSITSLLVSASIGNFVEHSTASLYKTIAD